MNLLLGDCFEEMDKLIAQGVIVDAIITDPPYGTTACKWDSVIPIEPMWARLKKLIKLNGAIVLFGSQPFTSALTMSNPKMFKYCWYWDKGQGTGFLNSKKQPLKSIEEIIIFYSEQCIYTPQKRLGFNPYKCKQGATKTKNYGKQAGAITDSDGSRYPLNVLRFNRDKSKEHPTQKPVALMEYLIKTYTQEGETVLDFTMGSGSTGVACVNTKRGFIGIERDPDYFNIAKERIKKAEMDPRLFV